jgi:CMP-N-acetylneuraminic acid synthetase
MQVVALICARGGSKGLPGKNIRPLAGRPLIAWSIAQAQAVPRITRVIVSTDCEQIAAVARAAGAEVPFMRPTELAGDDSPEWLSWRHALQQLHHASGAYPDVLICVPATAPLRSSTDLEACLDEFARNDADVIITVTDAHRNPYFSMVRRNADGVVGLVIPPEGAVFRRQDAPAVYDITPVAYVTSPHYVLTRSGIFEGRTRAVHVPRERAVDIDTLLDFTVAECLLAKPRSQVPAAALP